MDLQKCAPIAGISSTTKVRCILSDSAVEKDQRKQEKFSVPNVKIDVNVDTREVHLLVLFFLSHGPCQKTFKQYLNELLEYGLLPRRYHAWYSRHDEHSGTDNDDGVSIPLSYNKLVERYPHIEKDHLVKLLKQLLLNIACPRDGKIDEDPPNAADVPTLLGSGLFSLLNGDKKRDVQVGHLQVHQRWPHLKANQVHGLSLRELGGGFAKHHRAPSVRSACYAIAKPSTVVQNVKIFKKLRGHRNAVYCAIFDRSGRYVITGSDDRLVKIWSMETAFCLASCRGHEGDITDLAVSSNNTLVASASNDFIIRVWRLPEGTPISVLRGHTGAVTAIAFSPRPNYELLSSSDDGSCRIWDARYSQCRPRIYLPKPTDSTAGKRNGSSNSGSSSSLASQNSQILCCAYNANGTVFVTGSSDTFARVWSACISSPDQSDQPIHEIDLLACHEDDVNYVQFSGSAVASRFTMSESLKDDNIPRLRNPWLCHDYIVTCSRDGSAIIWSPKSRKYHGQSMRWAKLYQMKVPAPPLPPRPPRGGPRQRILPTPRGVNMIIWSLDNRFVLAAIMDCRICVWNAENSSLVHSLTGHTASSYVLDVHPFNPRIAMSAGYDGKAIIWDIWEGIPIHTYEVGRFKLVDGKFSPDGTSIVLSDDVGQIYLLSTGQGESVKDAKYDQFFLGDYRPLIHDTAGNALDQETQLPPHRRNMQDPLCDSSLMPYPDPYQTMFQKRRLGILGIEWRPPSIQFAIGPDFSLGQDYHMPPLEDWDRVVEPVPDFVDAIYWEPENEILNDDTDSEYNAAEEFASDDEQVSLLHSSPSDPSSSSDKSDVECRQMDGCRRSRRILKPEVQSVTAARKRIKKRNLDDCDGQTTENNKVKKSRSSRKVCKRKAFSKEKSSRPQRVAARNAQNMLNESADVFSDGDDEDVVEVDTSSSESQLSDSDVGSSKAERNSCDVQEKFGKDKDILIEDNDMLTPLEVSESQFTIKNSKKIVLKISLRDPKKPDSDESSRLNCGNQDSFLKKSTGLSLDKDTNLSSKDPASPSTNVDVKPSLVSDRTDFAGGEHPEKENIIGVTSCSSEAEVTPGYASIIPSASFDAQKENKIGFARDDNLFSTNASQDHNAPSCKERTPGRICHSALVSSPQIHLQSGYRASEWSSSSVFSKEDQLNVDNHRNSHETSELSEANHSRDLKESKPLVLPRFKIKTKGDLTKSGGPKVRFVTAVDKSTTNRVLTSGNHQHQSRNEEPHVAKDVLEVSHAFVIEDALNDTKSHCSRIGSSEAETSSAGRTRSMKAISRASNAVDSKFRIKMAHGRTETSNNVGSRYLSEDGTSCSKWSVGSKSSRSRRGVSSLPMRKLSWLLLSKNEEGYRYIPQICDEVVYVRQGHQEYVNKATARERGPWTFVKGLEAVEICKIVSLEYDTVAGSGDSCCKMELRCVNPSSGAFGQTFKLTLPELIDFPDFVVEKTRYDAAVSRDWTCGERCRVWWRNENGDGGSWWHGHVHSLRANSAEYPGSLWEKFIVQYDSTPNEDHPHCPWELQDLHASWEHPYINFEVREELLLLFDRMEEAVAKHEDRYGVKKLNEVFERLDFFNRFPVPLCPDLIQERLQNNYYRSLEAVEHDIDLMIKNAQLYFHRNTEQLNKINRLSNWFHRKLLKIKEIFP